MKRFKRILYHADGAESQSTSLARAVALAQTNDAALVIMDVIETSDLASEIEQRLGLNLNTLLAQRRREELEALIEPYRNSGVEIGAQIASGTPFLELIRSIQRDDYDLLMKAPRPPEGFGERLYGGSDMHILRKCPCPVWMDRPGSRHPYRSILAAVDPTRPDSADLNRLIMDLGTSLAERESAQLHIVHAWRLVGETILRSGRASIPEARLQEVLASAEQEQERYLDALLADYGVTSEAPGIHLVKARAPAAISLVADEIEADIIVIGTVGRTGVPGLIIGNTAEEVLQTTNASVLAVKPSAFVSPVTAV